MPPKKQAPVPLGVANPDIPLLCLLCPKKPTFSDVSHLLTHISSKSHLSNRFKTEIRSNTEPQAREILRQYGEWYTRYGIQGLLADRMSAKDKKTVPKRASAGAQGQGLATKSRPSYDEDYGIKPDSEPLSRRSTNESLHAHSSRQTSIYDISPYDDIPLARPLRRIYPAIGTPGQDSKSDSVAPSVASELEPPETLPDDEIDAIADIADGDADRAKLKGVFWPGMSLFDSATPDQKRKRNQRKDVAVVRNMEQIAASVEPTECIWSEEINLQRTRDIYATPSPVSTPEPEGDEEAAPPAKKKRARRSTATSTTAQPRPRRASARISKAKKKVAKRSDSLSTLDSYVLDAEVQRADETKAPSESSNLDDDTTEPGLKSEGDTFDIFRDSPMLGPRGPGQFDATGEHDVDPQCVSPALTWGSTGTESLTNAKKFEPGGRQPLQQLNSNIAVASPTDAPKGTASLRRGQSDFPLRPEVSTQGHYYGHHHPGFTSNGYNTIFSGLGHQYSYNYNLPHHASQSFAGDARPMTNHFHPINGLPYDHNHTPYLSNVISNGTGVFQDPPQPTYPDTDSYHI